jgi:hypothetical protein
LGFRPEKFPRGTRILAGGKTSVNLAWETGQEGFHNWLEKLKGPFPARIQTRFGALAAQPANSIGSLENLCPRNWRFLLLTHWTKSGIGLVVVVFPKTLETGGSHRPKPPITNIFVEFARLFFMIAFGFPAGAVSTGIRILAGGKTSVKLA